MQHGISILLAVTLIGTAYSQVPVYLRTAPAYHQSANVAAPQPSCASTCMPACQPTCIQQYNPVVPMSYVAPAAVSHVAPVMSHVAPALPPPSVAGSLISPIYQLPHPYYIMSPCMHSCMPSCSSNCIEHTTKGPETITTVPIVPTVPTVTQPETPPPSVIIPETTTPIPTTTTTLPPTTTVTLPTVPITFPTLPTTTEEEITPPPFTTALPTLPPITVPQADPTTTTESAVIGCQNICVVKIAAGIPLESVLERVMAKCPTIQCTCPAGYNQCGNKTCCKL